MFPKVLVVCQERAEDSIIAFSGTVGSVILAGLVSETNETKYCTNSYLAALPN